MLAVGQEDAVNILRFFDDLPDPRSQVNRLHRLGDVIVIAICAVLATADGPTAIAKWANLNAFWLRRHLDDAALLTGPVYASFQVAARRTAVGDAMGAEKKRQGVGLLRRKALDTLPVVCGQGVVPVVAESD